MNDCYLCGRSVCTKILPANNNGLSPKSISNKSVQHLWSYLFHHNVRETLSPSSSTTSTTISGVTTKTEEVRSSSSSCHLPKLSFDLYWNNNSYGDDYNREDEVILQLCDQCSEQLCKLDKLHKELEQLKILVSAQVQTIDNLCQSNCSRNETREKELNRIATHSLFQKDRGHGTGLSFAGVSTGKENISQLIKFLTTICEGIPSSSASSFGNKHNKNRHVAERHPAVESSVKTEPQDVSLLKTGVQETAHMEEIITAPSGERSSSTTDLEPRNSSFEIDIKYEQVIYQAFSPLIPPRNEDDDKDSTAGSVSHDITFDPLADLDGSGNTQNNEVQKSSPPAHEEKPPAKKHPIECQICKRRFQRETTLKSHQRTHIKNIKNVSSNSRPNKSHKTRKRKKCQVFISPTATEPCPVCGKLLIKRNMNPHIRTHTGERPFECDICHRKFNHKPALNAHKRLHTRQCPYTCNSCLDTFPTEKALVMHVSREHRRKTKKGGKGS